MGPYHGRKVNDDMSSIILPPDHKWSVNGAFLFRVGQRKILILGFVLSVGKKFTAEW